MIRLGFHSLYGCHGLGGYDFYPLHVRFEDDGPPIGSEIFPLSLMGILPAVAVLLLWQNNMIRWLKAVERYRNSRVKK